MNDAITIRVSPRRVLESARSDNREAFWSPTREMERFSNSSLEQMEAKLVLGFGPALRNRLITSVRDELVEFERGVFGSEFPSEMWRFLDHELHFMRREEGPSPYPWTDPFVKYFELRQHALSEIEQFPALLQRLSAAAAVRFSTRIRGYGSLDLDVLVGSAEKLSQVFDDNFDSFRVFLDCFVPFAFGDVFDSVFAEQLCFEVSPPASLDKAFRKHSSQRPLMPVSPEAETGQSATPRLNADLMSKPFWLWLIANFSLVVPVILALVVLYIAFSEVASMRNAQYELLKPVIEHQAELLKEDRERLLLDRKAATQEISVSLPPASQPSPQDASNANP